HLGQRFIITAHSMHLDQANRVPSSRRPQWATEIRVGSTVTTGSVATAPAVSPKGATASAGAATAEAAFGGGASAGVAATGDAAPDVDADDADAGGAAGNAAPDVGVCGGAAAAHGFGLAPGGGFGVTRGRHDERGAKTPW